jgi:hypothetical protein
MSIVKELATNAQADTDLLRVRDAQGDAFGIRRPVDFVLLTDNAQQAAAAAGFLADYQFASTNISAVNGMSRIVATIHMSLEQQEILAVSGFMQCIAALFSLTYDGWGAAIKTAAT